MIKAQYLDSKSYCCLHDFLEEYNCIHEFLDKYRDDPKCLYKVLMENFTDYIREEDPKFWANKPRIEHGDFRESDNLTNRFLDFLSEDRSELVFYIEKAIEYFNLYKGALVVVEVEDTDDDWVSVKTYMIICNDVEEWSDFIVKSTKYVEEETQTNISLIDIFNSTIKEF